MDKWEKAGRLAESGRYEHAWKIIAPALIENPLDPRMMVTGALVLKQLGHLPQSYHMARTMTQLYPKDFAGWANFGAVCALMCLNEQAEQAYRSGLECCRNQDEQVLIWTNLNALLVDIGRFREAEAVAQKILEVEPENKAGLANTGFCQLARRDWRGWKGYHHTIGTDWRSKVQYKDEPEWDGSPDRKVVLYSDQGLGDEISFASMVPDAIKVSRKLILECDPRLEGLFKRSFPKATVYGTRGSKQIDWDDQDFDCSLALGQIGEFFRTKDSDFPGTPYLTADPDRVKGWKAVFDGKPTIGIAWTGGVAKTNARNRRLSLMDFLPIFQSLDARFVSLQYKDAEAEIEAFPYNFDIRQYKHGTLTNDYDDTAALVASLDYVVCMQTAVAHTAGALGVPVLVLVPVATQWRYGIGYDTVPWYNCMQVMRQEKHGQWDREIERAAGIVGTYFASLPGKSGEAARDHGLRNRLAPLRTADLGGRKPNGSHPSA